MDRVVILLFLGQLALLKALSITGDEWHKRTYSISNSNSKIRCQPDWYSECKSNDECCSNYCDNHDGSWELGVCKKDNREEELIDDNSFEILEGDIMTPKVLKQ